MHPEIKMIEKRINNFLNMIIIIIVKTIYKEDFEKNKIQPIGGRPPIGNI